MVYIGKKYLKQMQQMLLFLYRNIAKIHPIGNFKTAKHSQNDMIDTLSFFLFVQINLHQN